MSIHLLIFKSYIINQKSKIFIILTPQLNSHECNSRPIRPFC